ncbi:MAG: ABC transporter ATP-binding protein [Planctomycetes bacterium]|nr:ABC transporter ATP-binding protein [Planctomycetota bacterium]
MIQGPGEGGSPSRPDGGEAPAVRLRAVRKRFGYSDVLRTIHLDVPNGVVFVLEGSNGAGKSTLLRLIATQWVQSSGTVEVLGYDTRRETLKIRAAIGAVFHESFLRRELSLIENLRFAASLHSLPWPNVEAQAVELVERFGLSKRQRDPVGTYSQGMTKRANLIRSLIHEPRLWVLDEPYSSLDVDGRLLLSETIREFVNDPHRTVLLVTHDRATGDELATAGAALVDGRLRYANDEPAQEAQ